jgi:hypothetical protein
MNARTQRQHKPNKHGLKGWLLLGLVTLLPACSSPRTAVDLAPVGPAPLDQALQPNQGGLVVYSAYNLYGDPRYVMHHSDYSIASDDGKMVRQMANHIDRFDEGPRRIALAAGKYTVTARSAHYGKVNVPVVIQPERTTCVYLDGYPHPEAPSAAQSNVVRLPDGEIAGWSVLSTTK